MLKISLEERKDYIAKFASKVFSKKGYQAASLNDVSRAAKISKAGTYYYFKSKEEILSYILIKASDQFLEKLKLTIKKNQEKELTPQESIKKLMEVYAKHVNNNKDKRLLVLRERHQSTGRNKKALFIREQEIFRLLRSELQKIPNLEKGINHNVITFLFISMSHWLGYWFKEGRELKIEEIIAQNIRVFFNGILKK